jgi:calcineurin-like phosphoesterase family protein
MSRVWYTSDLHFGHRLVAGHRGHGEDTLSHDLEIAERWERQVQDDDIVYVLGDIAVSSPTRALAILGGLPGRKRLIAGNHDRCHPQFRDAPRWHNVYSNVFEWIAPFGRRRIGGVNVLLSHYPYTADRGEVRDMQWRLPDHGMWLLHGHTHSQFVQTGVREFHVGWDAWERLVSEDEIVTHITDTTLDPCALAMLCCSHEQATEAKGATGTGVAP